MKRAKRIKPRNPLATAAIMKKGGAHARQDKRAARARQKARQRREFSAAE